jgi:hypothetical protein
MIVRAILAALRRFLVVRPDLKLDSPGTRTNRSPIFFASADFFD